METVKTALVVVLLLAVLYGVYVVLNKPDIETLPDLAWQGTPAAPPEIDFGSPQVEAPPTLMTNEPLAGPAAEPLPAAPAGLPTPAAIGDPALATSAATPNSQPPAAPSPIAELPQPPPSYDAQPTGGTQYADVAPRPMAETAAAPAAAPMAEDNSPPAAYQARSIYEQPATSPGTSGSAGPAAAAAQPAAGGDYRPARAFDEAWRSALDQLANQHWAEALLTLSLFYDKPDLNGQERQRLVDLLDPLAGKVIYSTEHLLEPPYQTRPGETLEQIAESHQLSVALLQNMNRIYDSQPLAPGTLVKVLRGPFRAEIRLDKEELVLFLGKNYAGRFAVSVGNDPQPQPGEYRVVGKQLGREYFAPDGAEVAANAPDNPYGRHWLDLGGDICIHGSADVMPSHGGLGCISLNSTDAADVYSILSIGSKVLIR